MSKLPFLRLVDAVPRVSRAQQVRAVQRQLGETLDLMRVAVAVGNEGRAGRHLRAACRQLRALGVDLGLLPAPNPRRSNG